MLLGALEHKLLMEGIFRKSLKLQWTFLIPICEEHMVHFYRQKLVPGLKDMWVLARLPF